MLPDHDAVAYLAQSLQVSLGVVFLLAVLPKLRSPATFTQTVAAYRILPAGPSRWLAAALVASEAGLAASLISGRAVEVALPIALLTVTTFLVAVGINLRRGRRVPCGCFGLGDDQAEISARSVVRLMFMLVPVVVLIAAFYSDATSPVALDSLSGDTAAVLAYLVSLAAASAGLLVLASWLLTLPELHVATTRRQRGVTP